MAAGVCAGAVGGVVVDGVVVDVAGGVVDVAGGVVVVAGGVVVVAVGVVVDVVVVDVVVVLAPLAPVSAAGPATIPVANTINAARRSVRRTLTREGTLPPGRRGREIGVH